MPPTKDGKESLPETTQNARCSPCSKSVANGSFLISLNEFMLSEMLIIGVTNTEGLPGTLAFQF